MVLVDRSGFLPKSAWNWRRFFGILGVVALPNIFFGGVSLYFGLSRPLVNFDYLLVGLLLILFWRWIGVVFLALVCASDFLALVGQVFPILKISDVFYLSRFLPAAPLQYKVVLVSVLAVIAIFSYIFLRTFKASAKYESLVLINLLLLTYSGELAFGGRDTGQVWRGADNAFVGSQLVYNFDSRNTGFVNSLDGEGPAFSEVKVRGATKDLFDSVPESSVLLVVNESWGVTDDEILDALISPILNDRKKLKDFQRGEVSFSGITIGAEFRELCQLHPNHFNFDGEEDRLSGCLPNLFKKAGFSTHSFHGAGGLMYDRAKWYPVVGFDERLFFETRTWDRRCYSFPGACDSDLLPEVKKSFSNGGKVFSYWLTLNSHAMYDRRDIHHDLFDCAKFGIPDELQTCGNLKLQAQFFYDLKTLVDSEELQGVEVIVVGDHEPPIMDKSEKKQYFVADKVPWFRFTVGA